MQRARCAWGSGSWRLLRCVPDSEVTDRQGPGAPRSAGNGMNSSKGPRWLLPSPEKPSPSRSNWRLSGPWQGGPLASEAESMKSGPWRASTAFARSRLFAKRCPSIPTNSANAIRPTSLSSRSTSNSPATTPIGTIAPLSANCSSSISTTDSPKSSNSIAKEPPWRLQQQVDQLGRFLTHRQRAYEAHRQIERKPPFSNWREGQEAAVEALTASARVAPVRFFEAPTGFGKTGLALDHALEELRSGRCSRIIFLTGKSSGQSAHRGATRPPFGRRQTSPPLPADAQPRGVAPGARRCRMPSTGGRWRSAGRKRACNSKTSLLGPVSRPEQLRATGERLAVDPHALARGPARSGRHLDRGLQLSVRAGKLRGLPRCARL
jgi:hypothetical protein